MMNGMEQFTHKHFYPTRRSEGLSCACSISYLSLLLILVP